MFVFPLVSLVLASTGFAASHHGRGGPVPGSALQNELPSTQTLLVAPNTSATYVTLGVGIQNYTCTAGNYTSIGALAKLFSISSLYGSPEFDTIQDCVYKTWVQDSNTDPLNDDVVDLIQNNFGLKLLGTHFFNEYNGSSDPEFDFTETTGVPSDYVIATKTASIPSPTNATDDVAWLFLTAVSGSLAKDVFRVETVGGQPPPSCASGSPVLTVPYVAKYWFF
ncbi:hypothetical protein EI94DRAFT_1826148 [Lactarius quietus]|nr:hypothetical protein EI94DRAFT_1826148 [Lactarius quietus]